MALTYLLMLTVGLLACAGAQTLKKLGQLRVTHAAFTSLVDKEISSVAAEKYSLLIAAFNPVPLVHDSIYEVPAIGSHLSDLPHAPVTEISRDVTWPNEVSKVPGELFLCLYAKTNEHVCDIKDRRAGDESPPSNCQFRKNKERKKKFCNYNTMICTVGKKYFLAELSAMVGRCSYVIKC